MTTKQITVRVNQDYNTELKDWFDERILPLLHVEPAKQINIKFVKALGKHYVVRTDNQVTWKEKI